MIPKKKKIDLVSPSFIVDHDSAWLNVTQKYFLAILMSSSLLMSSLHKLLFQTSSLVYIDHYTCVERAFPFPNRSLSCVGIFIRNMSDVTSFGVKLRLMVCVFKNWWLCSQMTRNATSWTGIYLMTGGERAAVWFKLNLIQARVIELALVIFF